MQIPFFISSISYFNVAQFNPANTPVFKLIIPPIEFYKLEENVLIFD